MKNNVKAHQASHLWLYLVILLGLTGFGQRQTDLAPIENGDIIVEYAVTSERPDVDDAVWKPLDEDEIWPYSTYWIRARHLLEDGSESEWTVFGPLEPAEETVAIMSDIEDGWIGFNQFLETRAPNNVISEPTNIDADGDVVAAMIRCCRIRIVVRGADHA